MTLCAVYIELRLKSLQAAEKELTSRALLNGFLHVVSCSGSQTSVSVRSLQITVCECSEIHTKGTSLPGAGTNPGF